MSSAALEEKEPLQTQLDEARQKMEGLTRNLHAIDGELEGLTEERERYELLEQVCGSLERLGELGAGELFWGQRVERYKAAEHVRQVRQRVEVFRDRLAEIETRRESVLDGIKQEQEVLDILEEDLWEAIEREEQRKNEWVVERQMDPPPDRLQIMPWIRGGEDDARFRRSLAGALLSALLLGLLFPFVDLPLPAPPERMEVEERFARLIRPEERPLPPPPVREEPPPEEAITEPEPDPVVAEETPEPVEPPPAVAQEEPQPRRPEQSGILAFRESFANLTENRPAAQLGSQARISTSGEAAVGRPERSMVTTQAPGSSGGINIAALSRDVGGGGSGEQIGGVEVTRVASSIGAGGSADRPTAGGSASAGRTDEEIQIVFDRYKAALYRLYNRELRSDPTLRGQMVLRVTIEPNGTVSMARLESTTMNAPGLAEQVLERVRTFDFGAKDVPAVTILYPIDFLPAV